MYWILRLCKYWQNWQFIKACVGKFIIEIRLSTKLDWGRWRIHGYIKYKELWGNTQNKYKKKKIYYGFFPRKYFSLHLTLFLQKKKNNKKMVFICQIRNDILTLTTHANIQIQYSWVLFIIKIAFPLNLWICHRIIYWKYIKMFCVFIWTFS